MPQIPHLQLFPPAPHFFCLVLSHSYNKKLSACAHVVAHAKLHNIDAANYATILLNCIFGRKQRKVPVNLSS